jgi:hypothetical protein
VLSYDNGSGLDFQSVAGFFREWERLRIYGEYYFNGITYGNKDHNVGMLVGYRNIFSSPVDVGVEWRHAFIDNSGRVIPAISFAPWPLIRMDFGIPILYGSDETRIGLFDDDTGDRFEDRHQEHIPTQRGISFLFSIRLSTSF